MRSLGRAAVLRQGSIGVQADEEPGCRLTRRSLETLRAGRAGRAGRALCALGTLRAGRAFRPSAAFELRSLCCSDPSITCLVPTLFFGRRAFVAANDVPPSAKNSASRAR